MLRVGTKLDIFVTTVESEDNRLYLWAQTDFEAWQELEKLLESCAGTGRVSRAQIVKPGGIYVAKCHEEDVLYRALVVSVGGNASEVTVNFIDFGNNEVVRGVDIAVAPDCLLEIPPQAQKFLLGDIEPVDGARWSDDQVDFLKSNLQNVQCTCKVVRESCAGWPPSIRLFKDESQSLLVDKFTSAGIGRKVEAPQFSVTIPNQVLNVGETYEVFISHPKSTVQFWIQLVHHQKDLVMLQEVLADSQQVSSVAVGQICVARHSGDYQRAVVTAVNHKKGMCSVVFVDYGNSELVSLASILYLDSHLARIPAQAVPCCLTGGDAVKTDLSDAVELGIHHIKIEMILKSGVHVVKFVSDQSPDFKLKSILDSNHLKFSTSSKSCLLGYEQLPVDNGRPLNVVISHVGKMGQFSCQLLSNCQLIDGLMIQLQSLKPSSVNNIMSGMVCLVQSTKDGLYYRGRVRDFSLQQVLVDLVDFGDVEVTSHGQIFDLPEVCTVLPQQAMTCILTGSSSDAVIPLLHNYESSRSLVAVILQDLGRVNVVELIDTTTSVDVKLSELAHSSVPSVSLNQKHPTKLVAKISPVKAAIPEANVNIGCNERLFITAVRSESEFFGQLSKYSQEELIVFQSKLMEFYSRRAVPILVDPQIGDICCTTYSQDGLYYRGLVMQCGEKLDILFIDYGNSEHKSRDEVKELHAEFCKLPVQGIMCRLSHDCTGLIKPDVDKRILDNEIIVTIMKRVQNIYEVKIHGHNLSNSGSSAAASHIRKTTVPVGTRENVVVVHTEDPGHFYCQLVRSQEALDSLMSELENYGKSHTGMSVQKVEIGAPVVARYTADDEWYRAVITGVMVSGSVEVHFVDYGNHEIVKQTRILPILPEFLELPCQAVCCCLADVMCKAGVVWPEEANRIFKTLVEDFELVMHVKECIIDEQHHKIELYHNEECINRTFARSAECFVSRSSSSQPRDLTAESRTSPPNSNSIGNTWAKGFEMSLSRSSMESHEDAHETAIVVKEKPFGRVERDRENGGQERRSLKSRGNFGEDHKERQIYGDNPDRSRSRRTDDNSFASAKRSGGVSNFGSHWQHDDRCVDRTGRNDTRGHDDFDEVHHSGSGSGRQLQNRKEQSPKGFGLQRKNPGVAADVDSPVLSLPKLNLKESQSFDVFVSYAISPSQFWCQVKKSAPELERLMQELNGEYNALGPNDLVNSHPSKLQICCAKYSEDEAWYRAKIINCDGKHVTVYFVDYGNSEDVITSDIKFLKENYLRLPFQAFLCTLRGVKPLGSDWSPEAIAKFQELTLEKPLSASIVEKQGERYLLTLADQSIHIHEDLIKAGLAGVVESVEDGLLRKPSKRPSSASSQTSTSSGGSLQDRSQVKYLFLPQNKHVDVNVVLTANPSEFWCQLTENTNKIQEMMDTVDAKYANLADDELRVVQPEAGQPCCAKYSEDGQWYRAVISELQPGKVKVSFIDYGNEEWLEDSDIREMAPSFLSLQAQAVKCDLYDIGPAGELWSEEATDLFESLTAEKNLVAKLISRSGLVHRIKLIDPEGSVDVGEELVEKGHAVHSLAKCFSSQAIKLGSSYSVLPSWVYSSQDFYVQLDSNSSTLLTLVEEMYEFYQRLKMNDLAVQDPHVGKACVAYHAGDGNWFRSSILKLLSNEVIIRYVDFGTKAKVPLSKVKEITTAFLKLPSQAIRCSLGNLEVMDDKWSEEARCTFRSVMQAGLDCKFLLLRDGIFEVELRDKVRVSVAESINSICRVKESPEASGDAFVSVKKCLEAVPVTDVVRYPDRLFPEGDVEVYLSNVISPSSFSVQLASEADDLEELSEVVNAGLTESLPNVSVGVPCSAKSSADGMWYRAIVSALHGDQTEVFFIDYGDTDKAPVSELRNVTGKMLEKMPFSIKCHLAGAKEPPGGWSASDIENFAELTCDKKLLATFKEKGATCEVVLRDGANDLSKEFLNRKTTSNTIPQFPAALIPAGSAPIYISEVNSPGSFYVNLASQGSELDTIVEKLAAFTGGIPVNNLAPGHACAAIFPDDDLWYRAVVKGLVPSSTACEVRFVDYGNSAVVEADKISALPESLLSVPALAIKCCLDGVDEPKSGWREAALDRLLELGEDGTKEVMANFITTTEPCKVLLAVDEEDVNEVIRSLNKADETVIEESVSTRQIIMSDDHLPMAPWLDAGKHQVMVIHIESVKEFYMQLARDNVEVEQLVDSVDTKYGCMNDDQLRLDDVAIGMLCCAKYSENEVWHRASVCGKTDDGFEVCFLDFGNKDVVPLCSLKQLTENFRKIPSRLYKCRLYGLPDSFVNSDDTYEKLFQLTLSKIITAEVKSADDECEAIPVILWDKDECINIAVLGDLYETSGPIAGSKHSTKEADQSVEGDSERHEDTSLQAQGSRPSDQIDNLDNDGNKNETPQLDEETAATEKENLDEFDAASLRVENVCLTEGAQLEEAPFLPSDSDDLKEDRKIKLDNETGDDAIQTADFKQKEQRGESSDESSRVTQEATDKSDDRVTQEAIDQSNDRVTLEAIKVGDSNVARDVQQPCDDYEVRNDDDSSLNVHQKDGELDDESPSLADCSSKASPSAIPHDGNQLQNDDDSVTDKSDKPYEAEHEDASSGSNSSCPTEDVHRLVTSLVNECCDDSNEDKNVKSDNELSDSIVQTLDVQDGGEQQLDSSDEKNNGDDEPSSTSQNADDQNNHRGPSVPNKDNGLVSGIGDDGDHSEVKKDDTTECMSSDIKQKDEPSTDGVDPKADCAIKDASSSVQHGNIQVNGGVDLSANKEDKLVTDVLANNDQSELNLSALETFGIVHDSKPKRKYLDSEAQPDDDDDVDDDEDDLEASDTEGVERDSPPDQDDLSHSADDVDDDQNKSEGIPEMTKFATSIGECVLAAGDFHDVFLSHVEDPDHIWCQTDIEHFADIMEAMAEYYSQNDVTSDENWSEGDICCVLATEDSDERCYRSQVKSCTEDEARVQYLDVGKMENVKLENLKPLIAKFGEADRLAVACSLHGIKPVADSWKPEATEVLAEESERPLVMRVIDVRSDHLPQVSLSSRNGSDLAEILINRSLALKHL